MKQRSFLVWPLLLTHVRRARLLLHVIALKYSGRGTSPSQSPLSDNTQHSQKSDIHAVAGIPHPRIDRAPPGIHYCTMHRSEICFRVLVCLLKKIYHCIQNLQLLHIQRREGQILRDSENRKRFLILRTETETYQTFSFYESMDEKQSI
jgi:hypothetical protein